MKNLKKALGKTLIAVSIVTAFSVNSFAQTGNGKIVFVMSNDQSGPWKEVGIDYANGFEMYFKIINANGGVFGKQIEFRKKDNGYDEKKAAEQAIETAKDPEVLAFVGWFGTGVVKASMPIAVENKIPFIAPYTGAPYLANQEKYNNNRYVFNIRANYATEIENMVEHISNFGIKNFAIVYPDDAYGNIVKNNAEKSIKAKNLNLVISKVSTKDEKQQAAAKEVADKNPEIIIFSIPPASEAAFVNDYLALGKKAQFFNLSPTSYSALTQKLQDKVNGVVISQVMPNPLNRTIPVVSEFNKVNEYFKNQYKPSYAALEGYVAAKATVEALKRTNGNITRESFTDAMESIKKFDAGGFFISFDKSNHTGSKWTDLIMIDKDGKIVN